MNTPLDEHDSNLRYAEYVLGVLDADARAAVEREIQSSASAAKAVAIWAERLSPLSEEMAVQEPAAYVWARIRDMLKLESPASGRVPSGRPRLWENLRFWHWWGLGASALAAVCLVLLLIPARHAAVRPRPTTAYMASTIVQNDGHVGWTATMDLQRARIIVVPVAPQTLANGRSPELWLIPAGHKPIAVGVIDGNTPTTIALSNTLIAQLGPTAALAVSVEPLGGSPTGQPTGPVIAKGTIGAAPESVEAGKSVSLRQTSSAARTEV